MIGEENRKTAEYLDSCVLGSLLRLARKRAGKVQEEASNLLGCARTTIVAIEAGQRKVSARELDLLARFYGTTPAELLAASSNEDPLDTNHVLNTIAFTVLGTRQQELVLRLLKQKPSKVVVRSLRLIGSTNQDLEEIACALLHYLLEGE